VEPVSRRDAEEVTLAREIEERGLTVDRQVPIAITYQGIRIVEGFRVELIVAGMVYS